VGCKAERRINAGVTWREIRYSNTTTTLVYIISIANYIREGLILRSQRNDYTRIYSDLFIE
jgi:hypothetical protein